MSRGRHDYAKAIHLIRVQGRAGDAIFIPAGILHDYAEDSREHAPDLQFWESLVARACDRYTATVHGYAWLPNEAILILQRFAVSLRIILPSLLGQYSRYLHEKGRVPRGESPYLCRCESIEVTPELLPYALRNLYARPGRAGLCTNPLTYPLCSLPLHFAESVPSWFETQEFLARVRKRGHIGRTSVESFLAKPESPRHTELFGRLSSRIPRIAGEAGDIEDSMRLAKCSPPPSSVEQVVRAVATILRTESLSADSVLAAALATWYATRAGAATLAQMGHWFGREPTTLRADIESHRKTSVALFELSPDELQALIRAHEPPPAALGTTPTPDVGGLAAVPYPASNPDVSETRVADSAPNTPSYGVPVLKSAPVPHPGGPSRSHASSGFASACMISDDDIACRGVLCDPEPTLVGRRWTRKGR